MVFPSLFLGKARSKNGLASGAMGGLHGGRRGEKRDMYVYTRATAPSKVPSSPRTSAGRPTLES